MQVAQVIEPGDDPVLVILGIAGAEYLRVEVARKLARGGDDAGDLFYELLLASPLHPPCDHRSSGWVFSRRRVTIVDKLFLNKRPQKCRSYKGLLNPVQSHY